MPGWVAADELDMAAAGLSRTGDEPGAPKLLEHCAAFERMIGAEGSTARARLEILLGGELASLLCRALTTAPRQTSQLAF